MRTHTITSNDAVAELGTILSIWAHPDDESYLAAGVMAAARGQRPACRLRVGDSRRARHCRRRHLATRAPGPACGAGKQSQRWPCSASATIASPRPSRTAR